MVGSFSVFSEFQRIQNGRVFEFFRVLVPEVEAYSPPKHFVYHTIMGVPSTTKEVECIEGIGTGEQR